MPTVRACVFDFDGTLADSFRAITASVNAVRLSLDLPSLSLAEVRSYVGLGLTQLMRDLAPGLTAEEAIARYSQHHETVMYELTELLPGVRHTLEALRDLQIGIAIASNKRVEFTRQLAQALQLRELAPVILGPEDVGAPKPQPAMLIEACRRLGIQPQDAVYIGDMPVDVQAAQAVPMPVWIVPNEKPQSEWPSQPDLWLESFDEILQKIR